MIVKNFNKENNCIVKSLKKIENSELNEILNLCKDEPVFFDKEARLLSISEILDSKEELMIGIDVIPIKIIHKDITVLKE